MSGEKFTPGPWKLEDTPGAGWEIKAKIPQLKNYKSSDGGSLIWKVPCDTTISATDKPQALIGYEPWVQFPPKWWIGMTKANANIITAAPEMYEALERANVFITNGIKFGYIRMPDLECGDSAWETPEIIRKALAKARGEADEGD